MDFKAFTDNIYRSWRTTLFGIVIALAGLYLAYNGQLDGTNLVWVLVIAVFLMFGKDPKKKSKTCSPDKE
jgi:NADH:ubiquinone oxidoreductase subunit 6 (subunit J)